MATLENHPVIRKFVGAGLVMGIVGSGVTAPCIIKDDFVYLPAVRNLPDQHDPSDPTLMVCADMSPKDCTPDTALMTESKGLHIKTSIKNGDIPQSCRKAFKAAEDKNYDSSHGVSFKTFMRAMGYDTIHYKPWKVVYHAVSGKGDGDSFFKRGGSGIYDETAQMAYLGQTTDSSLSTYQRGEDQFKAFQIAKRMELDGVSQDDAENMYYNYVPEGRHAVGVGAAAKLYFNKDAKDLTADQCNDLAIRPASPSRLMMAINDPKSGDGKVAAVHQMKLIYDLKTNNIDQQLQDHFITPAEAADLHKQNDKIYHKDKNGITINIPYVDWHDQSPRDYSQADAIGAHQAVDQGIKEAIAVNGGKALPDGTKLILTIDSDLQKVAMQAVQSATPLMENKALNAAFEARDRTGAVKFIIGSKDYSQDQNDYADNAKRAVGSRFKPEIVAQNQTLGDDPFKKRLIPAESTVKLKGHATWHITEGSGCEHMGVQPPCYMDDITGIVDSSNGMVANSAKRHGLETYTSMLGSLGITVGTDSPTALLGNVSSNVSEMSHMNSAMLNGGVTTEDHVYKAAYDLGNDQIESLQRPAFTGKRIFKTEYVVNSVKGMQGVFSKGTAKGKLDPPNGLSSAGGKTGTAANVTDVGADVLDDTGKVDKKGRAITYAFSIALFDSDDNKHIKGYYTSGAKTTPIIGKVIDYTNAGGDQADIAETIAAGSKR